MEFRYTYCLGTPETQQSFVFSDGDRRWEITREEDWCYNMYLDYAVRVPDGKYVRFFLYRGVYDVFRTVGSQAYGLAFDELEEFFRPLIHALCGDVPVPLQDQEVTIKGYCSDTYVRGLEKMYALLDGRDADARTDLMAIAKETGKVFDIDSCIEDMKNAEDSDLCYRQRLFDSVYRALY